VNLTYTWPEESGKLDGIWDETTIDFLNFLDQWIEKKPSMSDVAIRCELWRSSMMIGMKDEKKIKFKRGCWNINLILVLKGKMDVKFSVWPMDGKLLKSSFQWFKLQIVWSSLQSVMTILVDRGQLKGCCLEFCFYYIFLLWISRVFSDI
jgi:hypothetical protein